MVEGLDEFDEFDEFDQFDDPEVPDELEGVELAALESDDEAGVEVVDDPLSEELGVVDGVELEDEEDEDGRLSFL